MKLISTLLFFFAFTSAFAQVWPWFFSETAFKKWLIEKDVKCLKYVSADLPYEYVKSQSNYQWVKKGITSYFFDENSLLEKVKIEAIDISIHHDSLNTENNYNYIINRMLPYMPFSADNDDVRDLVEYNRSKFYPGIKIKFMKLATTPGLKVFANYQFVDYTPFSFDYAYELLQEIYLNNEEIISVKNYGYGGEIWIPYIGVIEYEKENDTLSFLKEKAHTSDYYYAYDTLIYYPYYQKTSADKKQIELGIRLKHSSGIYCFFPFKKVITEKTDIEESKTILQLCDRDVKMLPISFRSREDYKCLSHGSGLWVSDYYEYWWTNCNDDLSDFNLEKTKIVTKLNKKTNEFSEKVIYEWSNNEWHIISEETKTKTGYLQNYYPVGWKKPIYQIVISTDVNNNPVFTKVVHEKEEILFRISDDSIYLTKDENNYGHFLVEYE
ncbi:MAG: hypothetical protein IPM74_18490 [Crocinitomicaceae bacterium]|nr:hypothetical protein [Crocinitomicaceae bacterium]